MYFSFGNYNSNDAISDLDISKQTAKKLIQDSIDMVIISSTNKEKQRL
ncbi:MAG TPA: hypothetical protein PKC96_01635 [Bacilli bacterium]|nr:hypothetical protein [Bacilli bacterium]